MGGESDDKSRHPMSDKTTGSLMRLIQTDIYYECLIIFSLLRTELGIHNRCE